MAMGSLRTAISLKSLDFAIPGRGSQNESDTFLFATIRAPDSPKYDYSIIQEEHTQ